MHIDSEVSPVYCKTPLHRHKFSNWCTVLERFSFYQVLFFSCVRLISFLVVSAKMSGWKICRIKLHRRPRKEIRISAQVWFQAVNGLCLAEFKQWPSGQMGDKFSPIFRSLRLAARHELVCLSKLKESIVPACIVEGTCGPTLASPKSRDLFLFGVINKIQAGKTKWKEPNYRL